MSHEACTIYSLTLYRKFADPLTNGLTISILNIRRAFVFFYPLGPYAKCKSQSILASALEDKSEEEIHLASKERMQGILPLSLRTGLLAEWV